MPHFLHERAVTRTQTVRYKRKHFIKLLSPTWKLHQLIGACCDTLSNRSRSKENMDGLEKDISSCLSVIGWFKFLPMSVRNHLNDEYCPQTLAKFFQSDYKPVQSDGATRKPRYSRWNAASALLASPVTFSVSSTKKVISEPEFWRGGSSDSYKNKKDEQ